MSDKPPEISIVDRAWAATTPESRREILDRMAAGEPLEIRPLGGALVPNEFVAVLAQMRADIARAYGGPAVVGGEPFAPREVTFGRLQIEIARLFAQAPVPDHLPTDKTPPTQTSEKTEEFPG